MNKFSIYIDIDDPKFLSKLQAKGNASCKFYLLIDEWPFPSNSWRDFPLIVLNWWLEAFLILSKTGVAVNNNFMNGPFEYICEKRGEMVLLSFGERTLADTLEIQSAVELAFSEYKNTLVHTAEEFLAVLNSYSVFGEDLNKLMQALESVRSL